MGVNCGIVGLPNVGKSTLFSALTSAPVEAANYPFCTIDPNFGVVAVPDQRLEKITSLIKPKVKIPASVEFVDIAGLVKGASQGEGLGNQFLSHIRQVGAIVHVVRCFDDDNITHVHGKIDPISDITTIDLELALADLETIEKRLANLERLYKVQDKLVVAKARLAGPILERMREAIHKGISVRTLMLDQESLNAISDLHLISLKRQLYVCNVDESTITSGSGGYDSCYVRKVREHAEKRGDRVIVVSGQIEKEISLLESEGERQDFMESLGIKESGLAQLIHAGYEMLGLQTYFTAGEKEVRAWTFAKGSTAPQAAGIIHSDFERGFIRAEVYHCDDLFELGSEMKVKEKGKLRVEGKEYVVQDGDILHFRFNV